MVAVQAAAAPRRGALVAQLSKSVAKARIEPGRARRNVDIPRFFSWPIPSRGAFATDLDTLPPRIVSKAPLAPPRQEVSPGANRNRTALRLAARWERHDVVLVSIRIQLDPRGRDFPSRPRGPLSSRGSAPGFPIPGELPPSPERPTSGSLRPSAVSVRTRSSGSPTLASPPARRQPLCNPTTLNTHPPIAWETAANSTPARRCCPCCA